jgi:hypothetical protein
VIQTSLIVTYARVGADDVVRIARDSGQAFVVALHLFAERQILSNPPPRTSAARTPAGWLQRVNQVMKFPDPINNILGDIFGFPVVVAKPARAY